MRVFSSLWDYRDDILKQKIVYFKHDQLIFPIPIFFKLHIPQLKDNPKIF